MQPVNFETTLEKILQRDTRYHRDAYLFVREALDFTQKLAQKTHKEEVRHITGQELLAGIRAYGLQHYGPMTLALFNQWGLRSCEDFGQIVFNMVESNLLAKTEKDSPDDFKGGYDFETAFRQPFLPKRKAAMPEPEPKSTPG
jgi:uncharacterized repeat protein (TIGR04138 family)